MWTVKSTYSSHYHTEVLVNNPAVCGRVFRGHSSFCRLWALKSCASFRFIIKRTWEGVPAGPGVGEILLFPTLFPPSQSPFLGVCKVKSVIPRHRFPLWLILSAVWCRHYTMCGVTVDWIQLWEASWLLLGQTLKRFAEMANMVTFFTTFLLFWKIKFS